MFEEQSDLDGTNEALTGSGRELPIGARMMDGMRGLFGEAAERVLGKEGLPQEAEAESRTMIPKAHTEYLENISECSATYLKQEEALYNELYKRLKPEHPAMRQINGLVNEVLAVVGLPHDYFRVSVCKDAFPNVKILPYSREIRISYSVLGILDNDVDLLQSVLAHEVGHFMLMDKERMQELESLDRYVSGRINKYEDEYQADRTSVIVMARLKKHPGLLVEALKKLHVFMTAFRIKCNEKALQHKQQSLWVSEDVNIWLLDTHPHLARRISSMDALSKKMPVPKKKKVPKKVAVPGNDDFTSEETEYKAHWEDQYCWSWDHEWIAALDDDEARELEKRLGKKRCVKPESFFNTEDEGLDFLEIAPDEVNSLGEDSKNEIFEWWTRAINNVQDVEGIEDLAADIGKYDSGTIRTLLAHMRPGNFYERNDYFESPEAFLESEAQYYADEPNIMAGDIEQMKLQIPIVVKMLLRTWFEREYAAPKISDIDEVFRFLRDFRAETGHFLPCDQVYVLKMVEKVFAGCPGDAERGEFVSLCREYKPELMRGEWIDYDEVYLKEMNEWIKAHKGEEIRALRPFSEVKKDKHEEGLAKMALRADLYSQRHYDYEICIRRDLQNVKIDGSTGVIEIPRDFNPDDYGKIIDMLKNVVTVRAMNVFRLDAESVYGSQLMFEGGLHKIRAKVEGKMRDIVKELLARAKDTGRMPKIRRLLSRIGKNESTKDWLMKAFRKGSLSEYTEDHDRVRETDLHYMADTMNSDEFEEEYFGEGRNEYKVLPYEMPHTRIRAFEYIDDLWEEAEYGKELEKMGTVHEKAQLLLKTYPACSTFRDQRLVRALEWHSLETMDDLTKVMDDIGKCENIKLLYSLSVGFWHPLLSLACSRRLWEITERDGAAKLLGSVSRKAIRKSNEGLKDIGEEYRSEELAAINICFSRPSYYKDDLLLKFLDAAPDEQTTMAVAQLLMDPPPSIVRPRRVTQVAVSETISDALDHMEDIDKQEMLLYLLGHKQFYSGMDARFFTSDKDGFDVFRAGMIYGGEKYKKGDDDQDLAFADFDPVEEDEHDVDFKEKYIVSIPDAAVYLTKATGLPVEMMFRQGRITTTQREQRELLNKIFLGTNGIMTGGNGGKFLAKTAELIVDKSKFGETLGEGQRQSFIDLLAFALQNCPREKLTDLYLHCWYMSTEEDLKLPELISKIMQQYGPVFIKAGQYLATQTTSLPPEWTKAFRGLSDQNQMADKTLLYEYEQNAYDGKSPFENLGEKLAEGSMAAVYRGRTKDGMDVAVKGIHPWIDREIEQDIIFLDELVAFINANRKRYGVSLPSNLGEVTRKQIGEEIDVSREASNNDLLRAGLSKGIDGVGFNLPSYFSRLSNDQFYVMEYVGGRALDDDAGLASEGIDGLRMRNAVGLELLRQIIADGVYQADPNMGNFKAGKDAGGNPVVHWIDSGHVGQLNRDERKIIKDLILGIANSCDKTHLADLLAKTLANRDEAVQGKIVNWLGSRGVEAESVIDQSEKLLNGFLDFCLDENLILNESFVRLVRTLGLLRPLLEGCPREKLFGYLLPVLGAE